MAENQFETDQPPLRIGKNVVEIGEFNGLAAVRKYTMEQGRELEDIQKEISLLGKLRHPGFPKLLEVLGGDKPYGYVQTYIGQDLETTIAETGKLNIYTSMQVLAGLSIVLENLYLSTKQVHGDIKPSNIVVADNGQVGVIDFGRSYEEPDLATKFEGVAEVIGDLVLQITIVTQINKKMIARIKAAKSFKEIHEIAIETHTGKKPSDEPNIQSTLARPEANSPQIKH